MSVPTPELTQNNSTVDLVASREPALKEFAAEPIVVDEFVHHPVYQYYRNLYTSHLHRHRDNHLVHDIQENIWPMLTGETLAGPRKIGFRSPSSYIVDPIFLNAAADAAAAPPPPGAYGDTATHPNISYTFLHLGEHLSGHKEIIHGGLLATLLDELACRLAFQNFPSKKGVTANLNIAYKKPCYVNSYILVRCDVVKKEGRKCWVKAVVFHVPLDTTSPREVETSPNLLTECECLVIEPKWVQQLNNH